MRPLAVLDVDLASDAKAKSPILLKCGRGFRGLAVLPLIPRRPPRMGVLPQKMLALPVGSGVGFRFMVSFFYAFLLFPLPPTEPLFSRFIACRRQVFETNWAGVSKTSVLETGAMQQLRNYGSQPSALHPLKAFQNIL